VCDFNFFSIYEYYLTRLKALELFIGEKDAKEYAEIAMTNRQDMTEKIVLKARGRHIKKAVDVAEILKRMWLPNYKHDTIEIGTVEYKDPNEGKTVRVSEITIPLVCGP